MHRYLRSSYQRPSAIKRQCLPCAGVVNVETATGLAEDLA